MIEHTVSAFRTGLIEFVGGAAVEIDPPPNLNIGDVVQIEVSGITRRSISSIKWVDQQGGNHCVSYRHGEPVR